MMRKVMRLCGNKCGELTLARCQVPTKATLSLASTDGQGRENITKGLGTEIRTGRSLSSYQYRQTRLFNLKNEFITNQSQSRIIK